MHEVNRIISKVFNFFSGYSYIYEQLSCCPDLKKRKKDLPTNLILNVCRSPKILHAGSLSESCTVLKPPAWQEVASDPESELMQSSDLLNKGRFVKLKRPRVNNRGPVQNRQNSDGTITETRSRCKSRQPDMLEKVNKEKEHK